MVDYRATLVFALLLAWPSVSNADLRFARPAVDLGELRGGPVYQHPFEFVNDSTIAVEIVDVRLGCGCLRPVLEKRLFQPGEKGVLIMHIRTLGQPDGGRTWQAHVRTRTGKTEEEILLSIAAAIRNEITIEPSILGMTVDTTLRSEVTVTDHRPVPAKIKAVVASTPAIRVTTEPQKGGVAKLILEVSRTGLTADQQEETLNIYLDDPNYAHLQVPITLRKAPRSVVHAVPDKIEFRGASSGSRLIRLRTAGDAKVAVERVEADHPSLKCTWASGPGNDATLKVSLDARSIPEAATKANVRVRLLAPSSTTLVIPVVLTRE